MIFPFVKILGVVAVANAIPFKRYDNNTEPSSSVQFGEHDTTVTVDKFITITLPSTTLTVPATASEAEVASAVKEAEVASAVKETTPTTVTSTVVEYTTINEHGSSIVSPIATKTSTITSTPTTTSTITHFVTITEPESSSAVEACVASTLTVTVTEKESSSSNAVVTGTSTRVSAYPVEAEFTLSGTTTTITSFVDVTTTELFTTTAGSINETVSLRSNDTYQVPSNLRRAMMFAL